MQAEGGGFACIRARVLALLVGACFWYGRSWIIVNGAWARPYPPSAIAICLRWGGVGLVVSRESCVPALCVGDMHARRCVVPWWPLGHQGTLKTQQTRIELL